MIIVGGGISGLYTAYKEIQKNPLSKITILERNTECGGRMKTYYDEESQYEQGALKILSTHKLIIKLIKDIGFKDSDLEYQSVGNPNIRDIEKLIKLIMNNKSNQSLKKFIETTGDPKFEDLIVNSGYHHIFDAPVPCAKVYLQDMIVSHHIKFKPGLTMIINRLKEILLEKKVEFVQNYNYSKYETGTTIVLAIPPIDILKIKNIPQSLRNFIKQNIITVPLIRIYSNARLKPIKYRTVSGPVQRSVSISNKIHQIVYASGKYAMYWHQFKNIHKPLNKHIETNKFENDNVFPTFWRSGIHLQKKVNFKLFKHDKITCVGEAFSSYKRWMESALISVEETLYSDCY